MAKSAAQRQREYLERKAEKERFASLRVENVFRKPFFETIDASEFSSSQFVDCLEFVGIEPPEFVDDRGTEDFTLYSDKGHVDQGLGSLGRAEVMVESLVYAAQNLALYVQLYKQAEINARISELEASDLTDQDAKKVALKEAARLNKMLDQLDKQVRITFPQWKVTG